NPIAGGSDWTNLNFVAFAMPTVTIAADTNSVAETDGTNHLFTLTRTGDTNTDLTVKVNLSGSAEVGVDYNLSPALTNTLNTLVIPAGSNSITFAFQAINDNSVEGPETAIITVLEDPAYVIAPLGEATIT